MRLNSKNKAYFIVSEFFKPLYSPSGTLLVALHDLEQKNPHFLTFVY